MKDNRYNIVKEKLENGEITTLEQIFDYIPKEVVAQDLWGKTAAMEVQLPNPTQYQFWYWMMASGSLTKDCLLAIALIALMVYEEGSLLKG